MGLRKNMKIELIKGVPLFSHCTKKQLAAVAGETDELTLPKGKALATQGARGSEFVVIVEGSAEVRKNGRKINQLGAGDFLGEIALISGAARTATVTTTSDTRILLLNDRSFRRLTKEIPSLQANVLKALSERLQADSF